MSDNIPRERSPDIQCRGTPHLPSHRARLRAADEENLRVCGNRQGRADLKHKDSIGGALRIEGEDAIDGRRGSKAVDPREESLSAEILAREHGAAREAGGLAVGSTGVGFRGCGGRVPKVFGAGEDTGGEACYGGSGGDAEVAIGCAEACACDCGSCEQGVGGGAAKVDGLGGGDDGIGEETSKSIRGEHDESGSCMSGAVV